MLLYGAGQGLSSLVLNENKIFNLFKFCKMWIKVNENEMLKQTHEKPIGEFNFIETDK